MRLGVLIGHTAIGASYTLGAIAVLAPVGYVVYRVLTTFPGNNKIRQ